MHRTIMMALLGAMPAYSIAQDLPKPSPSGRVEQVVGLTKVAIEYSRPSARDRQIFGGLVPFDSLWRTGANVCSTIEFDGPVVLEDLDLHVPAGKYSILTVPGLQGWRFILNKDTELNGTNGYDPDKNVAEFKVRTSQAQFVETMTFTFENVVHDRAVVTLNWAGFKAGFRIYADCTEQAIATCRSAVRDPKADFRVFNNCAYFCLDRNVLLKDALGWAEKSVRMESHYWNVATYARLLAAQGQYEFAVREAEKSIALATEVNASDHVWTMRMKIKEWQGGGR